MAVSHPPVEPPTVKVVVAITELTIMAAAAKHNTSVLTIDIADQDSRGSSNNKNVCFERVIDGMV